MDITIEQTRDYARELHADQKDKAGKPYHTHLERVQGRLVRRFPRATDPQQHAALLHDSIEDDKVTGEGLRERGYSEEVVDLVGWLTRSPDIRYMAWIRHIAEQAPVAALEIKLADIEDNSDATRIAQLPREERSILVRYTEAKNILEEAHARRSSPSAHDG